MEVAHDNDGLYEFIGLFWSITCLSGWSVFRLYIMDMQFIILVIIGMAASLYTLNKFRKQFDTSDESAKCSKCPAVDENKKNGSK